MDEIAYGLFERRMYETPEETEKIEFILLAAVAFAVPLLLRGPQLLVGSVVNLMLVSAAINIRGWKRVLPLIVLPSIATVLGGVLFGPMTIFLIYLVPVIWLGNTALVATFRYMYVLRRQNYGISLLASASFKVLILASSTVLLIHLSVLPAAFAYPMSVVQMATALIGGSGAYLVTLAYSRSFPYAGA